MYSFLIHYLYTVYKVSRDAYNFLLSRNMCEKSVLDSKQDSKLIWSKYKCCVR